MIFLCLNNRQNKYVYAFQKEKTVIHHSYSDSSSPFSLLKGKQVSETRDLSVLEVPPETKPWSWLSHDEGMAMHVVMCGYDV